MAHHILITAGGTREYIDPVRYVSNASSGQMGYALAQAALEAGHKVPVWVPVMGEIALAAWALFEPQHLIAPLLLWLDGFFW